MGYLTLDLRGGQYSRFDRKIGPILRGEDPRPMLEFGYFSL